MADIVTGPVSSPSDKPKPEPAAYVWIVVAMAVVVAAVVFVMLRTERRARETAGAEIQAPPPLQDEGFPLVHFIPQDVKVEKGWSLLSGHHPTVTFTCRLAPSFRPSDVVVLCYRTIGSGEWLTAETHPRRDRTCRLTLRDLYRDMPYECFFVVSNRDTMVQSGTVQFTTE